MYFCSANIIGFCDWNRKCHQECGFLYPASIILKVFWNPAKYICPVFSPVTFCPITMRRIGPHHITNHLTQKEKAHSVVQTKLLELILIEMISTWKVFI